MVTANEQAKILNYTASDTAIDFHRSDAFVRGIRGPVGSGKSVACTWDIFMRGRQQAPGLDGIRKTRWIIARNTLPQLETTTIKTWLDWFPEHLFGKMRRAPPYTHNIKIDDMHIEVIFLALDKPDDQNKLLSFEVTGVWFNEAREIPFEIIQAATARVGRFPSKKDKPPNHKGPWPTWHGIILDTNPPNDDSWWYKCAEMDDWARDELGNPVDPIEIPRRQKWEFFSQPSGLSKEAENIDNLPGGKDYYTQQLGGKTKEWIDVYVHGKYGFIKEGMPVYGKSWNDDRHTSQNPIKPNPGLPIYVGIDASGRHPASIFAQRTYRGQWQLLEELAVQDDEGMGATAYAQLLRSVIQEKYAPYELRVWGDPAGEWKSQTDERTYFDILRANGIPIRTSPGLRLPDRIETVRWLLEQNVDGDPKVLVDKRCRIFRQGMNGGYKYKRKAVSGDTIYHDKPDKNRFSDVQDAFQYLVCGAGELNAVKGMFEKKREPIVADTKFKIF